MRLSYLYYIILVLAFWTGETKSAYSFPAAQQVNLNRAHELALKCDIVQPVSAQQQEQLLVAEEWVEDEDSQDEFVRKFKTSVVSDRIGDMLSLRYQPYFLSQAISFHGILQVASIYLHYQSLRI